MRANAIGSPRWARGVTTVASAALLLIGLAGIPDDLTTWFGWLSFLRIPVPWWILIAVAAVFAALSFVPGIARLAGPQQAIKYRDVVKLIHKRSGHALHSHNIPYSHSNSSRQQQVTAFGGADSNDYWIVKAPHGLDEFAKSKEPVKRGDIIRFEHRNTRRNLHSHTGIPSPLTGQQEVTAFGSDGLGDTNDNWRLDLEDGGIWQEEIPIRLIHAESNGALHSHRGHNDPQLTAGQQEVTCFADRDENDLWFAVKVRQALESR